MARSIVDIYLVEILIPGQSRVEAQEIQSISIEETDAGAEAVKTMRQKRRAIGYRRGVPDYEVSLEVKPVDPPEVDYAELKRAGTLFSIYYQEGESATASRFSLVDCLVTEVSKSANADGEVTNSVKILALDHKLEL